MGERGWRKDCLDTSRARPVVLRCRLHDLAPGLDRRHVREPFPCRVTLRVTWIVSHAVHVAHILAVGVGRGRDHPELDLLGLGFESGPAVGSRAHPRPSGLLGYAHRRVLRSGAYRPQPHSRSNGIRQRPGQLTGLASCRWLGERYSARGHAAGHAAGSGPGSERRCLACESFHTKPYHRIEKQRCYGFSLGHRSPPERGKP